MRNKIIITIAACMLFMLAGVTAFAGERVYIRLYEGIQYKTEAFIWANDTSKIVEFKNGVSASREEQRENLTEFANLLEGYFNQGFKLLNVTTRSDGTSHDIMTEYIFEKP